MSKKEPKDAGAEYAEIWGEAIHSNRHLRVFSIGLGAVCVLLIVVIIRIVGVDPPKPIVIRLDEVGRAEALAYEAVEAQANPLDPTTKYFPNRFIYDFYSPEAGDRRGGLEPVAPLSRRAPRQRLF